jgi:hypothetical protein
MKDHQVVLPTITIALIRKHIKLRLTMIAYILCILLVLAAMYYLHNLWISLPLFCLSLVIFQRTIRFRKQLCAMEVIGNTLIISDKSVNTVADIKSIRRIRSTRIGRHKFTSVDFKIDGTNKRVILMSSNAESPGNILSDMKKKEKGRSVSRVL